MITFAFRKFYDMNMNPFVTSGYVSPEYFCDRKNETEQLLRDIQGRSHTVMISPRRMGKTGLIQHCFYQDVIRENFYSVFIDIYATLCLDDFIYMFGNEICKQLRTKNALDIFARIVKSLKLDIGIDENGFLTASFGLGDIKDANRTLDELFNYIAKADKSCVIAIDEFQQISRYPEKNVEALLRTYIQHCNNATFIFAGSQRHLLQNMFASASKPFYHSANIVSLKPIDKGVYTDFVQEKFSQAGKNITESQIAKVYDSFEGHTWYLQSVFYLLYYMSQPDCTEEMIEQAIDRRIMDNEDVYSSLLYSLPEKQQKLLKAIAMEGTAVQIQSAAFIKKYSLASASSVQSATNKLLDKDLITQDSGSYAVNDRFFGMWLQRANGLVR